MRSRLAPVDANAQRTLAARGKSAIGRAHTYFGKSQGARRRRCGNIVDDEQRRDCLQYLCTQRILADLVPRSGPASGASAGSIASTQIFCSNGDGCQQRANGSDGGSGESQSCDRIDSKPERAGTR